MDIEKLLNLIQNEPHLFNPKMSSYSDKILRENSWDKIGMEMDCNGKWFSVHLSIITIVQKEIKLNNFYFIKCQTTKLLITNHVEHDITARELGPLTENKQQICRE